MIPSFSEELEVEVESVEKPKIYFSGKVYCRRELDMITAFFRGIIIQSLQLLNRDEIINGQANEMTFPMHAQAIES